MVELVGVSALLEDWWVVVDWGFSALTGKELKIFLVMKMRA